MDALLIRGHINQFKGGFRTRYSRFTGSRRGRINGLMQSLTGKAQVNFSRARSRFSKGLGKLALS